MKIIFGENYKPGNTRYLCVHHSGGMGNDDTASSQHLTVEDVNQAHKARWDFKSSLGWYVGYHFFVEASGRVTQCRSISEETAAQKGYNQNGIAISVCLAGNFTKRPDGIWVDTPTPKQKNALQEIGMKFPQVKDWNIVPHRALQSTQCYGTALNDAWARETIGRAFGPID